MADSLADGLYYYSVFSRDFCRQLERGGVRDGARGRCRNEPRADHDRFSTSARSLARDSVPETARWGASPIVIASGKIAPRLSARCSRALLALRCPALPGERGFHAGAVKAAVREIAASHGSDRAHRRRPGLGAGCSLQRYLARSVVAPTTPRIAFSRRRPIRYRARDRGRDEDGRAPRARRRHRGARGKRG